MNRGTHPLHPCYAFIERIYQLMDIDWEVRFNRVAQSAHKVADLLAKLAHCLNCQFQNFSTPSHVIQDLLRDEAESVSLMESLAP